MQISAAMYSRSMFFNMFRQHFQKLRKFETKNVSAHAGLRFSKRLIRTNSTARIYCISSQIFFLRYVTSSQIFVGKYFRRSTFLYKIIRQISVHCTCYIPFHPMLFCLFNPIRPGGGAILPL